MHVARMGMINLHIYILDVKSQKEDINWGHPDM
jgi:hypothetical protein